MMGRGNYVGTNITEKTGVKETLFHPKDAIKRRFNGV